MTQNWRRRKNDDKFSLMVEIDLFFFASLFSFFFFCFFFVFLNGSSVLFFFSDEHERCFILKRHFTRGTEPSAIYFFFLSLFYNAHDDDLLKSIPILYVRKADLHKVKSFPTSRSERRQVQVFVLHIFFNDVNKNTDHTVCSSINAH